MLDKQKEQEESITKLLSKISSDTSGRDDTIQIEEARIQLQLVQELNNILKESKESTHQTQSNTTDSTTDASINSFIKTGIQQKLFEQITSKLFEQEVRTQNMIQ